MLAALAALPTAVTTWSAIFYRWRWGVPALIVAAMFSGPIVYAFYPSRLPLVYRDVLIVLPLYGAFLAAHQWHWLKLFPRGVLAFSGALTVLVLVQMANPAVYNPLTALIGAKVWLFYLPLMAIGYSYCTTREDLVGLLRLFAVAAMAPCLAGIAMWFASATLGYYRTMTFVYGAAAEIATQDFAWFYLGGFFYRIPGLFPFASQHYGFTLFALVPLYMLVRLEIDRGWAWFARAALCIAVVASFMSGSRGAFVFVPMLLVLMPLLGGSLGHLGMTIAAMTILLLVALWFTGIEPFALFTETTSLIFTYGYEFAWRGIGDAFARGGWLGLGTGMNTGAARHALSNYEPDYIENWYAKALVELGAPGLAVVLGLMAAIIIAGWRSTRQISERCQREASAAILAFVVVMAIHSLKGWQVDLDPINFLYWLFVGIAFRLPHLVDGSRNNTDASWGRLSQRDQDDATPQRHVANADGQVRSRPGS